MRSRSPKHRRPFSRLAVLAFFWLVSTGGVFSCRADAQVFYFADRSFEIPYALSNERVMKYLHLQVSTESGRNYNRIASTTDRVGQFTYTAKGDGWYWFIVQVEEIDGSFSPPNPIQTPPGIKICVDTEKPVVLLRQVLPREKRVAVEWNISDKNTDLQTLRLDYRTAANGRWQPLDTRLMERAQFEWDPIGPGPFEVRLTVSDKAKNTTVQTCQVQPDPNRPGPSASSTGEPKVIYVNRRTFKLTYKIDNVGPSRIKHVQVWMTRNLTGWYNHAEASPEGPFEITVQNQGRYGFTLRPVSGVGRGPMEPRPGDQPQVWVEVDETPPTVQVGEVVVGEKDDANSITVNWVAHDKFLRDKPITIACSTSPEGPWAILKDQVENTGSCKCPINKESNWQFYIRVEAIDQAGNKAHSQTLKAIAVDTSTPKISDIGVVPSDNPAPSSPAPAAPTPGQVPPGTSMSPATAIPRAVPTGAVPVPPPAPPPVPAPMTPTGSNIPSDVPPPPAPAPVPPPMPAGSPPGAEGQTPVPAPVPAGGSPPLPGSVIPPPPPS